MVKTKQIFQEIREPLYTEVDGFLIDKVKENEFIQRNKN
jgi:hypothetical protein